MRDRSISESWGSSALPTAAQPPSHVSSQKSCRRNAVAYFAPATLQGKRTYSSSLERNELQEENAPACCHYSSAQQPAAYTSRQEFPCLRLVWAPRALQDPVTCDFQQVFSLRGTNLLAATTHLKELAGVLVSRLESDIWQVIPQRGRTGRVSGSLWACSLIAQGTRFMLLEWQTQPVHCDPFL